MTDTPMTCERLDALLPDWFDGTLGAAERVAVERHLAVCATCGPLAADVGHIVAEARALPTLRPARDLWAGIEQRIATPVTSIGASAGAMPAAPAAAVAVPAARPPRLAPRRWLAAAAALLVATTAALTYAITTRVQQRAVVATATPDGARRAPARATAGAAAIAEPVRRVATSEGAATPAALDPEPLGPAVPARPGGAGGREQRPAGAESSGATRRRERVVAAPPDTRLVANDGAAAVGPVERAYAREIGELAAMVHQRRGELDPATVAVLEHSLQVIDRAIDRSREALRRDPASGFLQEQLNHALDKKVGLLRTAARIPTRT